MSEAVLTERRGAVLIITLNRPEAMNAINSDLAEALIAALDQLDGDDSLSVGVLTGNGRGFCAGMDLKAFAKSGAPTGLQRVFEDGCVKPLVGAIEGFALAGGLEVALICDLLVAAEGAKLGIPEVRVGLLAAGGALMRLPQRLPANVAMELGLTGDPITAEQALTFGLINRVTPKGEALAAAIALAERIATNAPLSIIASKQIVRATQGRTEAELWDLQRPLMAKVFRSADSLEGATSFAEKRPPVWTGH